MKKRLFSWLLLLFFIFGLFASQAPRAQAASRVPIWVAADPEAGLPIDIWPVQQGGYYLVCLPSTAEASRLRLFWDSSLTVKDLDGSLLVSGQTPLPAPNAPAFYSTVNSKGGKTVIKILTLQADSQVESMFLHTEDIDGFSSFQAVNNDRTKKTEAAGTMEFDGEAYYVSIKGRGNATWMRDRNPYNITLYQDATYDQKLSGSLIEGVEAPKWSLLANYFDNSLLRNKLGYDMALRLGIGLESRFVDLWVDGVYLGNYLLTPKSDYQAPENGYIVEIDNYRDKEDPNFTLEGLYEYGAEVGFCNRITVKDNDAGVPVEEIQSYLQAAWDAIRDQESEAYLNYIDLDSWAKFYLLHEFYKSYDVVCGSILMHRDGITSDDKLIAGPVWDLDNAMGRTSDNRDLGMTVAQQHSPEGWYIQNVTDDVVTQFWLQELGRHESFQARVKALYLEYQAVFDGAGEEVTRQAAILAPSAAMNFECFGHLHHNLTISTPDGHGCVVTKTWEDYVENLRIFAQKRGDFLREGFGGVGLPSVGAPTTGTTSAVPPVPGGADTPGLSAPVLWFGIVLPGTLVLALAVFLLLRRKKK